MTYLFQSAYFCYFESFLHQSCLYIYTTSYIYTILYTNLKRMHVNNVTVFSAQDPTLLGRSLILGCDCTDSWAALILFLPSSPVSQILETGNLGS
jgi:hypothetical protein